MTGMGGAHHILFFDGVCGLCDRFTQNVLRADHDDLFRFAPLQSNYAIRTLGEHGVDVADGNLQTVFVLTADGALLQRSDAALFVCSTLKDMRGWASFAKVFPRPLRELGYRIVAGSRYGIFGKSDACMVPSADVADKFIRDS